MLLHVNSTLTFSVLGYTSQCYFLVIALTVRPASQHVCAWVKPGMWNEWGIVFHPLVDSTYRKFYMSVDADRNRKICLLVK